MKTNRYRDNNLISNTVYDYDFDSKDAKQKRIAGIIAEKKRITQGQNLSNISKKYIDNQKKIEEYSSRILDLATKRGNSDDIGEFTIVQARLGEEISQNKAKIDALRAANSKIEEIFEEYKISIGKSGEEDAQISNLLQIRDKMSRDLSNVSKFITLTKELDISTKVILENSPEEVKKNRDSIGRSIDEIDDRLEKARLRYASSAVSVRKLSEAVFALKKGKSKNPEYNNRLNELELYADDAMADYDLAISMEKKILNRIDECRRFLNNPDEEFDNLAEKTVMGKTRTAEDVNILKSLAKGFVEGFVERSKKTETPEKSIQEDFIEREKIISSLINLIGKKSTKNRDKLIEDLVYRSNSQGVLYRDLDEETKKKVEESSKTKFLDELLRKQPERDKRGELQEIYFDLFDDDGGITTLFRYLGQSGMPEFANPELVFRILLKSRGGEVPINEDNTLTADEWAEIFLETPEELLEALDDFSLRIKMATTAKLLSGMSGKGRRSKKGGQFF